MRKSAVVVVPLLLLAATVGTLACGEEEVTPTPTPTPIHTAKPTSTPAPMPTATPEGNQTESLFFEHFESGIQNWTLETGWGLAQIDDNSVLKGNGHKWARLRNLSWDDYAVKVAFKRIDGSIHFNYRHSELEDGPQRYSIGIDDASLYLFKQDGNEISHLVDIGYLELPDQWHEMEIRGLGNVINVFLDGELYLAYQDENPIWAGGVAFETLADSEFLVDDVQIKQVSKEDIVTEPTPMQVYGSAFIPDTAHYGDLVIAGDETKIIDGEKYLQEGNIYVNEKATLVIRNSQLAIGRGDVPTIHTYIFVSKDASLEIEDSRVFPATWVEGCLVCVWNEGRVDIKDSPTSIHYFDNSPGAQLTMTNSEMVFEIGGLLQVAGGDIKLANSTIGALALPVRANAHLDISGLESGVYFESWDVHEMIPEADYNVVLENTRILKDDFTGEYKHGPYERGWLFFLDPNAHVRISDSELRKVFIDLVDEDVEFENLKIGIPSSLEYRDIQLNDITMMGQWPFTITDSNVTIRDSDYLFLQPTAQSTVTLVNSHMVEFIPRDFFGTMVFENGVWTCAGEIIGGTPYHSMENDFTIKGTLRISPELRENLRWQNAEVKREYIAVVADEEGNPIQGVVVRMNGKAFTSDSEGKVTFDLILDEFNYSSARKLQLLQSNIVIAEKEVDFFTETPILITVPNTSAQ